MSKLYDLLRYWSSVLPGRCLRILLGLLGRLSRRLGLTRSSNRPDNRPPDRPAVSSDSEGFISASHVPTSYPYRERTVRGETSQSVSFSNTLALDTSNVTPILSQSPVQSPSSPFSVTMVASPRSRQSTAFPKPEQTSGPILKPTTPLNSPRYNEREQVEVRASTIPAGPLAVHRGRQRSLPQGWLEYTHPEGLTYFVDRSRNIRVVTEANIYEIRTLQQVTDFANCVLERAVSDAWLLNSDSMELVIQVDACQLEPGSCSYYFVDDVEKTIFWLDEFSTDSDELNVPDVSGHDHLMTHIRRLYWQHKEFFPVHHYLPEKSEQDLIATLTHSCIDVITATTSTSSYDRSQLETMLSVMKSLKNSTGSEGQRNCVVARLWTEIYLTRFINYHGEQNARLFRTQIRDPEEPSSLPLKVIFLLLFDAPSTHLATLKELYVDGVLYSEQWRKFIEALVADWEDLIFWTTVLLAANMSFLAIFNSPTDVMAESRAVTCSIVSTLCSTASIVIGLLHVRKHRPRARGHAEDGEAYLQKVKHENLGFRPLAIIYSLPYAFLMWAMVTFIAAILLYTFNCGLNHSSRFVVGAIAIGLCLTLIWAISYFWKDELHLVEDFRGMRRSLRWLSPVRLNRIAGRFAPRSHDPGAANDPIVRHWARRFAHENQPPTEGV